MTALSMLLVCKCMKSWQANAKCGNNAPEVSFFSVLFYGIYPREREQHRQKQLP
jgi:hypothetical protein